MVGLGIGISSGPEWLVPYSQMRFEMLGCEMEYRNKQKSQNTTGDPGTLNIA